MDKRTRHDSEIALLRLSLLTTIGSFVLFPRLFQPALDVLWAKLKNNALYRSSTFETLWTVLSYAAIEPWLTYIFLQHPEWRLARQRNTTDEPVRRPHGMRRPSRRWFEGLTYIAPLLLLDLTMIKKFADVSLESMLISGNYDPTLARLSCTGNTCRSNFLMPSVHNFSLKSPLQTQRALPDAAPSSRRLMLELICSFIIYDAAFFAFHLSMHILPGLRSWHAPHHKHAEIHPQITNQLHIFERLGLVLLANFSLNIIKSHVLTRTLFVPIFVWLLVEIHSGLDLPWGYDKILPRGWGGGARKHARHHASGEGGLEPYFEWCDSLYNRFARALPKVQQVYIKSRQDWYWLKMLDIKLRAVKDVIFDSTAKLVPQFVQPVSITAAAFLCGLVCCLSVMYDYRSTSLVFWTLNRALDCLDGSVARQRGQASDLGGYLDLLGDFIVYSMIPISCALSADAESSTSKSLWLSVAVLEATFHVNNFVLFYIAAVVEKRKAAAAGTKTKGDIKKTSNKDTREGNWSQGSELTSLSMRASLIEGTESAILFTLMLAFPLWLETLCWTMATLVCVGIVDRTIFLIRAL